MKRVTSQCSVTLTREGTYFEEWAFFDSKSGLVLGFNLAPKRAPKLRPCLVSQEEGVQFRAPFWGSVLGPQTCVELTQNFDQNLGPVSHSQKIIFVTLEHRGA